MPDNEKLPDGYAGRIEGFSCTITTGSDGEPAIKLSFITTSPDPAFNTEQAFVLSVSNAAKVCIGIGDTIERLATLIRSENATRN